MSHTSANIDDKEVDATYVVPVAAPTSSPDDLYEAEKQYLPGDELYIDPVDEAKIVRKLDLFVTPIVMILYIICALDRSNIGNAAAAGMTQGVGLKGNQLNVAVTVYFATYVAMEVPITMLTRSFPPSKILPIFIMTWAGIMTWSGFMKSYRELLATRILIGVFESGLFPFLNIYLSSLYKRSELPLRSAPLYVSTLVAGAIGGLICTGLVQMGGIGGRAGWQWIYLMEAILTVCVAVLVFFALPDNAESAWFFNEREREIVRIRERQRATFMGTPKLNTRDMYAILKDPKVLLSGSIQFCLATASYSVGTFMPVIISQLGHKFSGIYAQLMTVPVYTFAILTYLSSAYIMHRTQKRLPILLFGAAMSWIGFLCQLAIPVSVPGGRYAFLFLCYTGVQVMSGTNLITLQSNQAPQVKRSIAVAINQTMGNIGGIVAGQLYRATDKPNYRIGHGTCFGIMSLSFVLIVTFWRHLILVNRKRETMDQEERLAIIATGVVGDQHPDFRMVY